jgi:hypothetical protein
MISARQLSAPRASRLAFTAIVMAGLGAGVSAHRQGGQDRPAQVGSVDFMVVTQAGQPVADLKAEEITLRIDGRVRPIKSLRFVSVAEPSSGSGPGPATEPIAPAFATSFAPPAPRTVVLIVDDETMPVGQEQKVRRALNSFVTSLPPADRVALVTVPHGGIKVGFTTDRARLRTAIAEISPITPVIDPMCRTRDTLQTLASTVGLLTRASDQPLVVALLSSSLNGPSVAEEAKRPTGAGVGGVTSQGGSCYLPPDEFVKVGASVADARAQLYIINPDYSTQSVQDGIENLRGQTGAALFHLDAGTEPGLARIARETSAYCIATFDIDPGERIGVPHPASIKTTRKDVEIRARPYLVVGRAAASPGPTAASAPTVTTAYDLVRSGRPAGDLLMRATASPSRSKDGHINVIGLFEPLDPSVPLMTAAAALFDENGMAVDYWQGEADKMKSWPTTIGLKAPPGAYRLRIAAIDAKGRAGVVDQTLLAELQPAGPLQLSGLMLGVTRDGTFSPRLSFSTETRATGYVELYGGSEGAQVAAMFEIARSTNGPAILQIPGALAATSEEGRFTATATIPVGALSPGDYVIRAVVGVVGQPQGRVVRTLHKAG